MIHNKDEVTERDLLNEKAREFSEAFVDAMTLKDLVEFVRDEMEYHFAEVWSEEEREENWKDLETKVQFQIDKMRQRIEHAIGSKKTSKEN